MATPKQVTEPATTVARVTEPAVPELPDAPARTYDPRKKVTAYDNVTGQKLPAPVPETWLDGRFPRLEETPSSKKEGK